MWEKPEDGRHPRGVSGAGRDCKGIPGVDPGRNRVRGLVGPRITQLPVSLGGEKTQREGFWLHWGFGSA